MQEKAGRPANLRREEVRAIEDGLGHEGGRYREDNDESECQFRLRESVVKTPGEEDRERSRPGSRFEFGGDGRRCLEDEERCWMEEKSE